MKHSLPLALVCFCCTSCYHVYYAPNTANVPLLSNKGEAKLIGAYGSGSNSEANIGELQLAFAPLNNVGFMVNGLWPPRQKKQKIITKKAMAVM